MAIAPWGWLTCVDENPTILEARRIPDLDGGVGDPPERGLHELGQALQPMHRAIYRGRFNGGPVRRDAQPIALVGAVPEPLRRVLYADGGGAEVRGFR